MGDYIEIKIPVDKNNYDAVCNKIYMRHEALAIEEDGSFLKLYSDEADLGVIRNIVTELEQENIIPKDSVVFTKFENKNWNNEWETSIEPVYIYDRIVIYPSWKKDEVIGTEDEILIEIDPKMSFGTGHNETTQLMLEMFCDHLDERDISMLDVGTGTGILSIAGIKLGIEKAVAFDIDADSIENAEEYVKLNNVENNIELLHTTIKNIENKKFDVIAANIIRSVIIDNLDEILIRLKTGGKLFLSGVLAEEENIIRDALTQKNVLVCEVKNKMEWLGIYAVKTA